MKSSNFSAPFLRAFSYGAAGSGKTTLWATACDDDRTSPVLWLNCGGNPQSIRRRSNLPTMVDIEAPKDLNPIYDWLAVGQPIHKEKAHPFVASLRDIGINLTPESPKFKSLVFDGLTQFQRILVNTASGNVDRKPGDAFGTVEWSHWGQVLNIMINSVWHFYGLDMHVMLTALEDDRKDDFTGKVRTVPWLFGQSREEVPAYALLSMRILRRADLDPSMISKLGKDVKVLAVTAPAGNFDAKDQYGGLPGVIPNPTITKIMDYIEGKVTK